MLSIQEMTCVNCGTPKETYVECRVGKDGLVRFFVECHACGGEGHQLEYGELNRAVRQMLLKRGYEAVATVIVKNF